MRRKLYLKLYKSIYIKKRLSKISHNIVSYVNIIIYDICPVSFMCLVFNEASRNAVLAYVRAVFTICYARLYFKIRICVIYVWQHQDTTER